MPHRNMFVGLDVHKESIDLCVAQAGRTGEVRHSGVVGNDLEALTKVLHRLQAPGRRLHVVYEAGPCGFGIYRHVTAQGEDCVVISPSRIPRRSSDRVKTDRRDAQTLARLHRAGELSPVQVPTADDEGLRDLVRAREDAVDVCTQAKHRVKAFLLRQGRRCPGRARWSAASRNTWRTLVGVRGVSASDTPVSRPRRVPRRTSPTLTDRFTRSENAAGDGE